MVPGVPHQLTADDNYRGYFLPRGSTVLFNAWLGNFSFPPRPAGLIGSQGNYPERGTLPGAREV